MGDEKRIGISGCMLQELVLVKKTALEKTT